MPPVWEPEESESGPYGKVQKHSDGMISFEYQPPSEADLEALKKSPAYRKLLEESGDPGHAPGSPDAPDKKPNP